MFAKKKSVSMKALVLLLAVVLLVGCVAGGTLAYLMTNTTPVTNTFVVGTIGTLGLSETKGNKFMIVPGKNIEKDPVVTFSGNNVDAYVFLKVDAAGWNVTGSDTTYTYSIGTDSGVGENKVEKEMKWTLSGWTKLKDGVYYKEVAANTPLSASVIKDNTITVENGITESDLGTSSIYAKSLTFTAYAIQKDGFNTVDAAWAQAEKAG